MKYEYKEHSFRIHFPEFDFVIVGDGDVREPLMPTQTAEQFQRCHQLWNFRFEVDDFECGVWSTDAGNHQFGIRGISHRRTSVLVNWFRVGGSAARQRNNSKYTVYMTVLRGPFPFRIQLTRDNVNRRQSPRQPPAPIQRIDCVYTNRHSSTAPSPFRLTESSVGLRRWSYE